MSSAIWYGALEVDLGVVLFTDLLNDQGFTRQAAGSLKMNNYHHKT